MKKFTLLMVLAITASLNGFGQCASVCPAVGLSTAFEWINSVSIGPLSNASGNNGGYADFGTSIPATFTAGTTVSYTVVAGYGMGPFSEGWVAWMDFNQDGDFDDPGEEIFTDFGKFAVSGSFSIPSTANNGFVKLRVAMSFGGPTLCNNVSEGEIEDYCVTITGGSGGGCDASSAITGLNSTVGATEVSLSWTPLTGSEGCRVSGGVVPDFTQNLVLATPEVSSATIPIGILTPGSTYNWNVICACSLSPLVTTPTSATATFDIPILRSADILDLSVNLHRNPIQDVLGLNVESTQDVSAQIMVTDLLGRSIIQAERQLAQGINSLEFDLADLSSGNYILTVNANEGTSQSLNFVMH